MHRFGSLALLMIVLAIPAAAHNGPPFPIITDRRVGPVVISLWTHPDVGTGTFWVIVNPPKGGSEPKDLRVQIGVQPVTGRLKEKRYNAMLDNTAQLQYYVETQFDAQEVWRIHLLLDSAAGHGEDYATVFVTPPGLGRWDLLWYASPFAAVGLLWFRAMSKRRKRAQPTNTK